MSLKSFKIKVENECHSREIQEWLFSLGYTWNCGSRDVKGLKATFLYLERRIHDVDGDDDLTLTYSYGEEFFETKNLPEAWFYDGQLQDRPKPKDKANTFRELMQAQLDGKTLQVAVLDVGWVDCTHTLDQVRVEDIGNPVRVYRIKPKPRYCNGIKLDPCLTEAPELGTNYYYYPDPMHVDYYGSKLWVGDGDDIYWLELGFAYATRESAAKHGHAMGITMEG